MAANKQTASSIPAYATKLYIGAISSSVPLGHHNGIQSHYGSQSRAHRPNSLQLNSNITRSSHSNGELQTSQIQNGHISNKRTRQSSTQSSSRSQQASSSSNHACRSSSCAKPECQSRIVAHHHGPHHQHHRVKPSLPLQSSSSFGPISCSLAATTTSSLHGEDFSLISPYVKYSLFFFNLIFWFIGAILIALGCWSLLEEYDYNLLRFRNIFDFLLHISLALVLAGLIIFSMSFTGCLGALRENLCLIKLYSLMLLLLFVGEVILSSVAFIFPHTLSHFVKERLSKDLVTLYREDSNLQNLIDIVQMEFKCCGVSDQGYKDWSMNIYFNCSHLNPSSERCAVPFSCCRNFNTGLINIMCGYNMQNLSSVVEINKYIFTRGCVEAMSELVERNMNLVAGVCLGSALAQLFAMFLARSLQGQIFAQRARWM